MENPLVQRALETLSQNTKDHWATRPIRRIRVESAKDFYRFASRREPVVITNALEAWPAMKYWDAEYLKKKVGSNIVSVNVTPNGMGDAVVRDHEGSEVFAFPEERSMKCSEFLDLWTSSSSSVSDERRPVFYLSHQNDSLRTQFAKLLEDDVPSHISWASELFGSRPDAVNLWIGDRRSRSSLHQDYYENLYAVVRGEKEFVLISPSDVPFLYASAEFPTSQYCQSKKSGTWSIDPVFSDKRVRTKTSWVPVDVRKPDLDRFPLFRYVRVFARGLA